MTATVQEISPKWLELLRLLPGYDPCADAGECWFDEEAAQWHIDFIESCCTHVKGAIAGQPLLLAPHEKAIVSCLFGWKRVDGTRRYREAFIYLPRKNSKTTLVAAIANTVLFTDNEAGAENYCAAADRDQASLLFAVAKGMVQNEPELSSRCQILATSKTIHFPERNSFLRAISAEAATKHGYNSHLVVIDELHAQPNRELVDVLMTSTGARRQPLIIHITTADYMRQSICNEKYEYACKVRDGIVSDPSFLPVIFEADRDEDWTDEKVWAKANPNLGRSISLEYLRRECTRAKEVPAYENTFRRLHLNQRTDTDVRAIPMDKWDLVAKGLDPVQWRKEALEVLKGMECIAGLDLGATSDLTALVLLFELSQLFHIEQSRLERLGLAGKTYAVLPYFWCPMVAAKKRQRRDRVPYETWAKHGFITLTEGEVQDYAFVRQEVNDLSQWFFIRELAADRWNATQIITELAQDGANIVAYGQGFRDMAAPVKALLELTIGEQIQHGGNPVLRWHASNAATEMDPAGNLKFSKKKSTEKIDGIIGETMALGRQLLMMAPSAGFVNLDLDGPDVVIETSAAPPPAPYVDLEDDEEDDW